MLNLEKNEVENFKGIMNIDKSFVLYFKLVFFMLKGTGMKLHTTLILSCGIF